MNTSALIESFVPELITIRHDLHANPEIGFKEERTSRIVADLLRLWNIEVHTGIGTTGVVGILEGSRGPGPRIGLRADMDALPIVEETGLPFASKTPGLFHGCGHDGHTTILWGSLAISPRPAISAERSSSSSSLPRRALAAHGL